MPEDSAQRRTFRNARPILDSYGPQVADWINLRSNRCMVAVARNYLAEFVAQDCRRCLPCREGARSTLAIMERVLSGQGMPGDWEKMHRLVATLGKTALCPRGKVLSRSLALSLETFYFEYSSHIEKNRCSTIYIANRLLVLA